MKSRLVGYEGNYIYRMFINDKVWRVYEVKWLKEKGAKDPDPAVEEENLRLQPNPAAEPSLPHPTPMDVDDADELSIHMMPWPPSKPPLVTARPPPLPTDDVLVNDDPVDGMSSGQNTPSTLRGSPAPALANHDYLEQRDLSPDPLSYYTCLANATAIEVFKPKIFNEAIKNNSDAKKWQDII